MFVGTKVANMKWDSPNSSYHSVQELLSFSLLSKSLDIEVCLYMKW